VLWGTAPYASVMSDQRRRDTVRLSLPDFGSEVEVEEGKTVMEALRLAGLALESECGGQATCGTCRVRFLDGAPPESVEDGLLLGADAVDQGWRLACQTILTDDCRIALPAAATAGEMRILTEAYGPTEPPPEAAPGRVGTYGAAVDIGTTTVVCYLLDLGHARQVDAVSFVNPQSRLGPDVISRIVYAHRGREELLEARRCLVEAVDEALAALCAKHRAPLRSFSRITAVGNPTMLHLLCAVDPWPLGVVPYQPVFTEAPPVVAAEAGFQRLAAAELVPLPGVAGHLGADAVAGVVALGLPRRRGLFLFIDMGTNGELVLISDSAAVGASCAAGPAFEGVHISSGMPALPGAIEWVDDDDGRLALQTIDGAEPRGVCGSGLIDAMALLVRRRILTAGGRLRRPVDLPSDLPLDLRGRLREESEGRRFVLHENTAGPAVALTQRDVREVQLAKAPIRVGVEVLLEEVGAGPEDVDAVFVAGAFGSSVRPDGLITLGILPAAMVGRIHPVGNVAGMGAKVALTSDERLEEARELARRIRHVELMLRQDFHDRFADHIAFPEPTTP
jgi:uncharacterized 2Fe-2S/4Fe-4S cluster protein (DUF4445 family)